MRYRGRRRVRLNLRGKILVITLVLVAFVIVIDGQLRPLIQTIAASKAKSISTVTINEAVTEELSKLNISYDDLINIERDSSGKVLAVTTDVVKMNMLKSAISAAIQNKLSNDKAIETDIPIGTLIGGDLFSGRGPAVPLKLSITGSVMSEFKSGIESAGINQTMHKIYLDVKTDINAIIPGYRTMTEVETNVLVAETVVVGTVPNVFATLTPNSTGTLGALANDTQLAQ